MPPQSAPYRCAAAGLLLLWGTAAAQTHTVGVFFDESAQTCTAEVTNFAPRVHAYVYALVPAGTVVNGAVLSVALPSGMFIVNERAAKDGDADGQLSGSLSASDGASVTLQTCPVANGPLLLLTFDLYQADPLLPGGARVPDMLLDIRGGVIQADSLRFDKPQVKICPEDPINGTPELVEALPIRTMLNCSAECPCTVPLHRTQWATVKRLFRGR